MSNELKPENVEETVAEALHVDETVAFSSANGRLRRSKWFKGSTLAWTIWAVSAIFVLFQFFLQLTSGEMVSSLMHDFTLTAVGGSVLASSYYYIYVILQTPAGMLMDRFGPRKLLTGGAIVCGMGCMVFAASHNILVAVLGRLLMGGGAAFAFVGSLYLISQWFPQQRFAFMVGVAEAVGMLGTIFGGLVLAKVIEVFGWRESMVGSAVFAFVMCFLLFKVIRDRPKHKPGALADKDEDVSALEYEKIQPRPKSFWYDIKCLLSNPVAWLNGLYSGFMFSFITVFVALWGIPFLRLEHHLTLMQATVTVNLVFVGVMIGGPIMGWLDQKFSATRMVRRSILSASALIVLFAASMIFYVPAMSMMGVYCLMVVLGVFCSAYVINFAIAHEIVEPNQRAASIGFTNTLSVGVAPLFQPLLGFILHHLAVLHGHAARLHGVIEQYTLSEYQTALTVILVVIAAAIFIGIMLPGRDLGLHATEVVREV